MIAGRFFVTPHAVERFRERIAPHLTYEEALGAIIHGLKETTSAPKPRGDTGAITIRVRRPYNFRAVIMPGDGPAPAVVTILRSGGNQGRRRAAP